MEFCLDLSHHAWAKSATPNEIVSTTLEEIRAADEAGLDSIWLSEDPDGWDAFAVLGAAARMTTRIRLGTGVTNPYLRPPNLMAMSVATLDRLSNGRAFLGLGRGQPEWYSRALGMTIGSPLQALTDTVDLLHQWWAPPYVASGGKQIRAEGWAHAFGPQQTPPIYLAAVGPKALELAARRFDGLLMTEFASEAFLARTIADIRSMRDEAGLGARPFPIFLRAAINVTDDPEPALNQRKNMIALVNSLPGMDRQIEVPGFDVSQIMERVRAVMHTDEILAEGGAFIEMRKAGDFAAARSLIPTELVEAVSYVGSPEKIKAKLAHLATLGVSHVFVSPPGPFDAVSLTELIASVRPV